MKRSKQRKFTHIKSVISDVMSEMEKKTDLDIAELRRIWIETLGPPVSDNTRPGYFKGGVLVIYTSDSIWSQHLQYLKQDLIEQLSAKLPSKTIEDIRFKVGELY